MYITENKTKEKHNCLNEITSNVKCHAWNSRNVNIEKRQEL